MEKNIILQELDNLKLKGEHGKAIKICEKNLLNDPHFLEMYEEIGDNFISLKEYKKAEKALKFALKIDNNSANTNYLIGFLYSATGKWGASVKHLEKANEVQPNHPEILRCLGWSIFHNTKPLQGLAVLERSMNLSPNDPLILCDLGVCYLNEKRFTEAIRSFSKVISIEPNNEKAKECLKAATFFKQEFEKLN